LEGARPLLAIEDVLEALDLVKANEQQVASRILPADTLEANILQSLSYEPIHVDEICTQLNLPIEKLSAALTMMELKGMVRQIGGMNYVAIRESNSEYRFDA
jgi:DNA processing protein